MMCPLGWYLLEHDRKPLIGTLISWNFLRTIARSKIILWYAAGFTKTLTWKGNTRAVRMHRETYQCWRGCDNDQSSCYVRIWQIGFHETLPTQHESVVIGEFSVLWAQWIPAATAVRKPRNYHGNPIVGMSKFGTRTDRGQRISV